MSNKTKAVNFKKKLNFMNLNRSIEPMSDKDKYLLKSIEEVSYENIQTTTRGRIRSQYS